MANNSTVIGQRVRRTATLVFVAGVMASLGGCGSNFISAAGPTTGQVIRAPKNPVLHGIQLIDVNDGVARKLMDARAETSFADTLGDAVANGMVAGVGDVLEIVIWEAPPATLFGSSPAGDAQYSALSGVSNARSTTLPEQMVGGDGRIAIPFAGSVPAAGQTTQQIAAEIVRKLSGKAHLPQVQVRISRNATALVTVVGDVAQSTRLPLTVKGERLLDAIASAGGVRQPVDKITIQMTRGSRVERMPLATVIGDPRQNIILAAGDVVTALFQPLSFTVLGATGRNEELPMEARGITLAQALGRIGGLQDQRADARGLFIFRFEDPVALGLEADTSIPRTPEGKVAVIYRLDLRNPASFFAAQSFPMRDKDIVYVSNAPLADVQKFVSIITSTIFPVATLGTMIR